LVTLASVGETTPKGSEYEPTNSEEAYVLKYGNESQAPNKDLRFREIERSRGDTAANVECGGKQHRADESSSHPAQLAHLAVRRASRYQNCWREPAC
jgi:hypothetical protein